MFDFIDLVIVPTTPDQPITSFMCEAWHHGTVDLTVFVNVPINLN